MLFMHKFCKYFVKVTAAGLEPRTTQFINEHLWHLWHLGVVIITTTQLQSTKREPRFSAGSNPARGVSEIRDGEVL